MTERKGIIGRTGDRVLRFGSRRIQVVRGRRDGEAEVRKRWGDVLESIRPRRISRSEFRAGYEGRYADGGRDAFARMVRDRKIGRKDLESIRAGHARTAMIFGLAAIAALTVGLLTIVTASQGIHIIIGLSLGIYATIMGGMALRSDFCAWQIGQRRFAGPAEYFRMRRIG